MTETEQLCKYENMPHVEMCRACSPRHCEVCLAAVEQAWRQTPGVLHAEVQLLRVAGTALLQLSQTSVTLHKNALSHWVTPAALFKNLLV